MSPCATATIVIMSAAMSLPQSSPCWSDWASFTRWSPAIALSPPQWRALTKQSAFTWLWFKQWKHWKPMAINAKDVNRKRLKSHISCHFLIIVLRFQLVALPALSHVYTKQTDTPTFYKSSWWGRSRWSSGFYWAFGVWPRGYYRDYPKPGPNTVTPGHSWLLSSSSSRSSRASRSRLVHCCTIFLCCLDAGCWNDHHRNPNMKNRDHLVG